jgi:hypothetical protein
MSVDTPWARGDYRDIYTRSLDQETKREEQKEKLNYKTDYVRVTIWDLSTSFAMRTMNNPCKFLLETLSSIYQTWLCVFENLITSLHLDSPTQMYYNVHEKTHIQLNLKGY